MVVLHRFCEATLRNNEVITFFLQKEKTHVASYEGKKNAGENKNENN
jgi:hypothetical protein